MPIVQISRIQHRRGKRTDLPQLAAGELGWVIDEQRLFIGNGTVADGAPAVGNTEIVTSGSSAFTTALNHTYKGYLGDDTPITTTQQRTLAQRLDEYVSVKDFGAKGDGDTAASIAAATDDTTAIQNAINEIYIDTDSGDSNSRRILFFPAGKYKITSALKIPPYAHLVGEGPDKTIIRNQGNNAVMVTQDTSENVGESITALVDQIQISNMTIKNSVAYGGMSIDRASKLYFDNVRFEGSYASGGADDSNSKGVTVTSSTALACSKINFNQCQFSKFARLVDMSFDVDNVRFNNCDFSEAYYGAIFGDEWDNSTSNGMTLGPRGVHFTGNSWSDIGLQAIYVKPKNVTSSEAPSRNIVSYGNWYGQDVANNFQGVNSLNEVPVIQFDQDECTSMLDFFERTDQRDTDFGDSTDPSNTPPEVQGIGIHTKAIRQITLSDNTSTATDTGIYLPGLSDKGVRITYKINRGTTFRTGVMVISAAGEFCTANDDYEESNGDAGVTLTAKTSDGDSTGGNDTIRVQYETTNTGSDATMEYQIQILV